MLSPNDPQGIVISPLSKIIQEVERMYQVNRNWLLGIVVAVFLGGCNMANVKPSSPDEAATTATGKEQAPASTHETQKSQTEVSPAASASDPATASALKALNNQNDRLDGRLVLLQGQILELKRSLEQVGNQSQMILSRLQLLTGSGASSQGQQEHDNSGGNEQMDAAIAQLMSMLNSMGSSAGGGGPFQIATTYTNKGDWILLKYRTDTGESWIAANGGWQALNDRSPLPESDYRITVERADKDLKGYVAVRVDEQTGNSWWLKDKQWNPYP